MVSIQNLSFGYNKNYNVYNNVSIDIFAGKVYGLLGLNGSGKTTLLKLLAGIQEPQQGLCLVNGEMPMKRSPILLSNIFWVSDDFYLPNTSIEKYMLINAPFYKAFSHQLFYKCLSEFEVNPLLPIKSLSYGDRKKIIICFAIATNAKLLLFDEPTNGLDIPSKSVFRKLIAQTANDEKCILISTHQVRDLENILDHLLILSKGKFILDATMLQLTEKICIRKPNKEDAPDSFLYSPKGLENIGIFKNTLNDDSYIDIEMLFNGILAEPKLAKHLSTTPLQ